MFRERVLNREKLIGFQVNSTDVAASKIAGCAGYDFVWVDGEHSYLSYENILHHIITLQSTGTPVIVRVPEDDLTFTKKVMEMGPDGIIFPMIHNVEEAKRVMSYTLFPPYGDRGIGPNNAINYGVKNIHEYIKENTDSFCRFVQIERLELLAELDEIINVPFIDGFIFGPFDFLLSMGINGSIYSDEEAVKIKEITDRLHQAGKAVGLLISSYADWEIEHWKKLGIDFISAGSDYEFLKTNTPKNREVMEKIWKNS